MTRNLSNWAGNYTYQAVRIHRPETIEQIQDLVMHSEKVKALGTRHSFNDIADSPGGLISMERFDKILGVDHKHQAVTVEAGVRYGTLARWLHGEGYALHNLASLPHISVAGACATGTHGSGDRHGNLATAVSGIEFVAGNGEVIALSRDADREQLEGAVVGLGGLGVITKLTLDVLPAFQMQQDVYEDLPLSKLESCYGQLTSEIYSVSLFTNWRSSTINQVWLKRLLSDGVSVEAEPELFGASLARKNMHPIANIVV
jgi:xylitol oxidase